MKTQTCVRLEKAEFDLITEALLAGRVGDEDRDIKPLKSLVRDNSPVSRERLWKAIQCCEEIAQAVDDEIEVVKTIADRFADPRSDEHMAFVILEARQKMVADLERCHEMLYDAYEVTETPVTDRDKAAHA
jgi:hypothetical protein